MQRNTYRTGIAALVSAFVGLSAAPLAAQDPPPPQQVELDSTELDEFVEVYIEVQDLNTQLQTELEQVNDVEEAQGIQQEYTAMMMDTIRANDMTPDYYGEVVRAINRDMELRERFTSTLQRIREEESGGQMF